MRLIDADALLKQIDIDSVKIGPGQYGDEWRFMGTICNAPTIDPVRQPHAMWINQDVRHMGPVVDLQAAECSACGCWLTTPYLYSFKHYEYCPYCGAKMDRGDEYETD